MYHDDFLHGDGHQTINRIVIPGLENPKLTGLNAFSIFVLFLASYIAGLFDL